MDQTFEEDNVDGPDTFFDDDSDLSCNTIIGCVTGSVIRENVSTIADGDLVSAVQAELMDGDHDSEAGNAAPVAEEAFGPGKRKRRANTLYKTDMFWRHHDDNDPNDDLYRRPVGSGLFSVSDQQIWQLGSFAAFGWVTVTYTSLSTNSRSVVPLRFGVVTTPRARCWR